MEELNRKEMMSINGGHNGSSYQAGVFVGDIIEVGDADAVKRYIERGIAEPVETPNKEKAVKKVAASTATKE